MSILEGGLFSNPRGKTGGVVFGAARTRTGKKVTSRLLVPPSNPNTAAQQTQRGKFAEALAIVRLIGSGIYQSDFNRSIGQLPGFQSMTSIYLNSMDAVSSLGTIPPINLGSLHKPATYTADTPPSSKVVKVDWSTELGINGHANDIVHLLSVEQDKAASPLERDVKVQATEVRSDGTASITMQLTGTVYDVLMYMEGVTTAPGVLSPTDNVQPTSGL